MCVLNDMPLPYVAPSVVAVLKQGIDVLLGVIVGCKLYCIRVSVDFEGRLSICLRSHCFNVSMYYCRWMAAMCGSWC